MSIEHNGKQIKEIYHGDKPIKEVYHGDKKVWSKDTEESVPPYAMLHAMKTATSISIEHSNYESSFEDKTLSINTSARAGWLGVLMAGGGSLTLKNGSTETLTLTRAGNTVSCFSRSDQGNTGTSTVTIPSTSHPFVPVAVHISSRTKGYTIQVSANNVFGNKVDINSSGIFAPTDNLKATSGTMNALSFGFQWTPTYHVVDWRYSDRVNFDGSKWFQQAMQHNVGWDDFFGQPRQWGTLPTSHRTVTGRSEGWRYSSPVGYKEYSYTQPEGVRYSEEFWLGGAHQDTPQGGGQGGQGGRSGSDYYNGDCLNTQGNPGGCSNLNGTGADGSSGLQYYASYRWHFQYSRTRNTTPNIATIRVGRGSMYCCAAYWGDQERSSSEYKNAGGPGGAGGIYQPGTMLYSGTMPSRPARDTTQTTNTFYSTGFIHTNGTIYNRPYNTSDNIRSFPLTYDYWSNENGYNEFHPQVPSMCHGLVLETFIPNDDCSYELSDTWWAKYKPFYRPKRSIEFYSDHSGQRMTWPPEPTCKNRETEYKDIGAGGFGAPGAGGAGGNPAPNAKQNGLPGQPGKSSYIDAGGTGAAVIYYEFEEPKVV